MQPARVRLGAGSQVAGPLAELNPGNREVASDAERLGERPPRLGVWKNVRPSPP